MHTVFTHNGGYDMTLLVNDQNEVLSAWGAGKQAVQDYLKHGENARDWVVNCWPIGTFDNGGEPRTKIEDYGVEIGRDGYLTEERLEFYK